MVEQCIDEGSVGVSSGRVDHQSGRLVDDEQMLILKDDLKRYLLRFIMRGFRLRNGQAKRFFAADFGRRIAPRSAFALHGAATDQRLQSFARKRRYRGSKSPIEAPAGMGWPQAHIDRLNSPHS